MKRIVVLVIALACMLSFGVGQAGAHAVTWPTTLDFMHFEGYPGNALLSGNVVSDKSACVPGRKATLYIERPLEGKIVLDTALTSSNGGYGLRASFNGDDTAFVKIAGRKVGHPGHRQTCAAVTVNVYTPV
jgi:hypothetical protein